MTLICHMSHLIQRTHSLAAIVRAVGVILYHTIPVSYQGAASHFVNARKGSGALPWSSANFSWAMAITSNLTSTLQYPAPKPVAGLGNRSFSREPKQWSQDCQGFAQTSMNEDSRDHSPVLFPCVLQNHLPSQVPDHLRPRSPIFPFKTDIWEPGHPKAGSSTSCKSCRACDVRNRNCTWYVYHISVIYFSWPIPSSLKKEQKMFKNTKSISPSPLADVTPGSRHVPAWPPVRRRCKRRPKEVHFGLRHWLPPVTQRRDSLRLRLSLYRIMINGIPMMGPNDCV